MTYEDGGVLVSAEKFTNLSMNPGSARFAPMLVSQSSALGDPLSAASNYNQPAATQSGYSQTRRVFSTVIATLPNDIKTFLATNGRFQISVNESQFIEVQLIGFDPNAGPPPTNAQDVADKIRDAINTQLGAAVAGLAVACKFDRVGAAAANLGVLRITSATEPRTSVTIRRAASNDITAGRSRSGRH